MRIAIAVVIAMGIAAPVFAYWQSRSAGVRFEAQALVVGAWAYRAEVPYEAVLPDGIVVGPAPQTSLTLRTNGIGWPGFGLGWFRNAAGERVFALVRTGEPVHVPTTLGYGLVLTAQDPDAFVETLRRRAAR